VYRLRGRNLNGGEGSVTNFDNSYRPIYHIICVYFIIDRFAIQNVREASRPGTSALPRMGIFDNPGEPAPTRGGSSGIRATALS